MIQVFCRKCSQVKWFDFAWDKPSYLRVSDWICTVYTCVPNSKGCWIQFESGSLNAFQTCDSCKCTLMTPLLLLCIFGAHNLLNEQYHTDSERNKKNPNDLNEQIAIRTTQWTCIHAFAVRTYVYVSRDGPYYRLHYILCRGRHYIDVRAPVCSDTYTYTPHWVCSIHNVQ